MASKDEVNDSRDTPVSQALGLCTVCSTIDLAEYFRAERDDRIDRATGWIEAASTAKRLGFLRDICLKAHECSFCQIIVQSICTTYLRKETTPEALLEREQAATQPRECWLYSYCSAKNDRIEDGDPNSKAIRIGIAYRAGVSASGGRAVDGQIGDIQLLHEDSMRVRNSRAFFGRRMDPTLDLDLVAYWLNLCRIYHGVRCNGPSLSSGDEPKDLLVIDVKRKCITKLPAGARYLVLSYCWPTREMFRALLANVDELFRPGALSNRWDELPAVIQDTINLTFDFGETYLWVDALCIVQDDQAQKYAQIAQMDRVYTSALMTIVPVLRTLDPDKACSGLPRYNPKVKTRGQKISVVQGMHLAVPFEAVFGVVDGNARWSTRAWTYQECLLSRRILFLTESQAYFQCRHSIFCEDCRGEIDSTDVYFAPGTSVWNPGALETSSGRLTLGFGTLHLPREAYATDERAILAYLNYVQDYSVRQLTQASDALNAFRGIQNVLCDTMQTSFWHGMPEKYLDNALLFIPYSHRPRAKQSQEDYIPNPGFPSWTWAAWNCAVDNGQYFLCTSHGIRREVDWFIICEDDYAIALESKGRSGMIRFPHADNKELGMLGSIPSGVLPPLRNRTSVSADVQITDSHALLSCWTMALDLYLPGRAVPLGSQGKRWPASEHLAICDGQGRWIGSILLNKLWVQDHLDKTRPYRFILISRSEDILMFRDHDVSLYDTGLFESRPWCFLNVMMVDVLGSTAQKLGIGAVHEDAWLQGDTTRMLVKLE
ncbi:HET-domain-containing protein [Hypoxylon sp. NC1633]|nr:HET-domain-containing protein [Hypoxylon sp. NC1633]